MHLEIRVVPNAKRFSVLLKDGITKIYVAAKAENNEANAELVKKLSKALGAGVSIVKGLKSRNKVLEIKGEKDEILEKIRKIAEAP